MVIFFLFRTNEGKMIQKGVSLLIISLLNLFLFTSCLLDEQVISVQLSGNDLKHHLILLKEDFSNLPPELIENEMIFVGEQHRNHDMNKAFYKLMYRLAEEKPLVVGFESVYSLYPFYEAASFGQYFQDRPMPGLEKIAEHNQKNENEILLTAVDLDHCIYHTKKESVIFLNYLADLSSSQKVKTQLKEKISNLPSQDTYTKMNKYLYELKNEFMRYSNSFSHAKVEDIKFAMEILIASNEYQYRSKGLINTYWWDPHPRQIRYNNFIKTIKKAYTKAKARDAILLCKVGRTHISRNYKWCESEYFAKEYGQTKNKTHTIGLYLVKNCPFKKEISNLMKDYHYAYLPLNNLPENLKAHKKLKKFYYKNQFAFDSLLLIKSE